MWASGCDRAGAGGIGVSDTPQISCSQTQRIPHNGLRQARSPNESVVAEKFEAIVKLGMANSRMKDFYDLWVLAQRFQFESATLAAAIQATFATRETVLPISLPLALQMDFYNLPSKQMQWKAFLGKSGLNAESSLEETIRVIREFVMPVAEAISKRDREKRIWQAAGPWK
jgi:hypothetical protein